MEQGPTIASILLSFADQDFIYYSPAFKYGLTPFVSDWIFSFQVCRCNGSVNTGYVQVIGIFHCFFFRFYCFFDLGDLPGIYNYS